ncbi:MAG: type 1 glutamine amidotransferase domain-containing protein [Bacteroidales bacterium]
MKKLMLRIIPLVGMMLILSGCPQDPAEELTIDRRPHVAILVAEGFHDGEAYMPYGYLTNQGIDVTVIGPEIGPVTAYNSDFTIGIERTVNDVSRDEFEALIIPGGKAPSVLREDADIVDFVTEFFEDGKITAAICHGPQVLVTADVLEGRTITGVSSIKEEIEEAGAEYRDEELVIDDNLITSRVPDDLDSFSVAISEAVIEEFDDYVETVLPPQPGM